MNALYLQNGQLTYRDDLPRPMPAAGEALIRVGLAGICATDLELVKGYAGGFTGVLGHEFVGVVEQCDDASWLGRRVVGSINIGCGRCEVCRTTGPEHCLSRRVIGIHDRDGAFAPYLTLPTANLVPVADGVADEEAVFTEPLAAAVRITEQLAFEPATPIGVVGPGRLGMLIAKVLALHGGTVTVFGRSTASLALPLAWGLETATVDQIVANRFPIMVEATGNAAGLASALKMVRPLGTLVLKSTFAGRTEVDLTKIVVDEITVIGSRCGPFDRALALLQNHLVPVTDMIEAVYPLEQGLAAFEHAARRGVRKVLLNMSGEMN